MGSSLRRSHRAWLLKVVGVLATCFAAGLVAAGVVSGTSALASLSTETAATPSAPSIWAEKEDYVPSELVTLWAAGWGPGESVEVFVNDDEGRTWSHAGTAVADELGGFLYEFRLPDWFVATYQVTATGGSGSVARSSFADSVAVGASSTNSSGGSGGASQELTISAPAVSAGDVLVAQVVIADSITNTFICPPAGWTSILKNNRDDKILQETFWFRAATATGAVSHIWRFRTTSCGGSLIAAGTKGASGGVTRFTGVVASGSPVDVALGANSSSSGPFIAPPVVTTVPDTRILRYFGVFKNTNITDAPAPPPATRLYQVASSTTKERTATAFDTGGQALAGPALHHQALVASGSEAAFQTIALKSAVAVASDAPVVDSPICAGATSVSGTSSEATGTTIEVFVDGGTVGTTTTVAGGTWSKGGLTPLVAGNQVTARATATGETTSPDSAIVTVSSCNVAPAAPADLGQFRANGTTPIALAGYTNETSAVLQGNLTDPDASDMVKLQVEVKPIGTGFDETDLVSGPLVTEPATAAVTVSGLAHGLGYHWRARAIDDDGSASSWQSFGGNAESAADFTVDLAQPTLTASATSPPSGPAYVAGTWTNQDVEVAFACQDALSGVAADTVPDVTVSTDGADQSVTSTGACTDVAGNSADAATFSDIDLDKTAPVDVETLLERGADHNGWYNAPLGWATSGDDATSGIASCSAGNYAGPDGTSLTVSGFCTDEAGNNSAPASSTLFDYDATAPVDVATLLERAPDHNGWYNAPLGWESSGTDATSGIDSCSAGTYSAPDGVGLTVSGSCTDIAGNTSATVDSAAFDFDATAPVDVETLLERGPDHNGWYNAAVGWETSGTDATSGIAFCSTGTYAGPDGTGLTVSGSCTDAAGNSSAALDSDAFDYDATAPADIETLLERGPDQAGWYNAPVGWETSGTDTTSGLAACSAGTYAGPDGTSLTVSGFCTDEAGNNSAPASSTLFDYDATAPVDVATLLERSPDHNGWYNAPLGWETSGTDATSGIGSCSAGTYSAPDGTGLTVSGSCTDAAGNTSASVDSAEFDYDATAPVDVATELLRAPDHDGWYNAAVDWETSGTDATSGIATCSAGTYSGPDGTALTVSGTCTDAAGNTSAAADSDEFDYDATAPVDVETTLVRAPDHNGWYNAPVDWETTATDATSGIAICSGGTFSGPDGTGHSVSGSCTDGAGNSSSPAASSEFDYDATAPVDVETLLERAPDHAGWYNAPLGWEASGTDATSGIDSCSAGTYSAPDGTGLTVSGSCTDQAGNTSAAATSEEFDYDATAPVDVETLLERGPDHNGWYNAAVGWETSGTDATSGIDSCSAGTYSAPDGTALTVSGSCTDVAGNTSAAADSEAFDYDATAPVDVETLLERGPDHAGWYNAAVGWETSGDDATSGIASCSSGTYSAPDGTALTVSGSCTDAAGNASGSVASEEFDYDATAPADVATELLRAPDHNGWYNVALGWETSGTDATSGLASCSSGTYSAPDGTDLTVSGSCTDAAGNTSAAADSDEFDYDATAPVDVETLLERGPDHNGWYNAPVAWETLGDDATSGIATCSAGTYSAPDGTGLTVSGSCSDQAGNGSGPVASEEFDYDATAPANVVTELERGPDHAGWYNAPVAWETTGDDETSGIATCSSGTYGGPDATGLTVSGSCTDQAGNTSASVSSEEFDYDATAPQLSPTVSPNPVVKNGSATASPNATDNLSGVASASCAPVVTSSVGAHSVPCTATDNAGNTANAPAWYSVVFGFQGFFQPVDNGGVFNVVQAGRAIPVKFSLGGNQGLGIFAAGYPAWTTVSCTSGTGSDPLEETLTAGSSSLQYDATVNPPAGQYIYVWKTDKTWANSCRRLDVKLGDGTTRSAYFSFKK